MFSSSCSSNAGGVSRLEARISVGAEKSNTSPFFFRPERVGDRDGDREGDRLGERFGEDGGSAPSRRRNNFCRISSFDHAFVAMRLPRGLDVRVSANKSVIFSDDAVVVQLEETE